MSAAAGSTDALSSSSSLRLCSVEGVSTNDTGCFDTTCSDVLCKEYPECCTVRWDAVCAATAQALCRPAISFHELSSPCPLGFICEDDRKASCAEIQRAAIELYQVGDIYGGILCPEGNKTMINCPVGSYCPTPVQSLPCPAGFFCPHKSRDYGDFVCSRCEEGALQVRRDGYGYAVLFVTGIFAVVAIVIVMTKRYKANLFRQLHELQRRQTNTLLTAVDRKRKQEQLERIRPKLEIIASRLTSKFGEDASKRGRPVIEARASSVHFNSRKMFELLDADTNGYLSYGEINEVLELNPVELHDFIRRLNDLETNENTDPDFISQDTFVKYFVQVLEETSHLTVSSNEAAALFDELAKGKSRFWLQELHTSSISDFLSETQVYELIKLFRQLIEEGSASLSLRSDSFKSVRAASMRDVGSFLAGGGDAPGRSSDYIGREAFITHYPKFLIDVTSDWQAGALSQHVGMEESAGVDICFHDLSLSVKIGDESVNVVNHVTGRVAEQTMTALLGGSGAGKTSLLNALCGRAHYGEVAGTIYINGHKTSLDSIKDRVGFVPQDDIMYAELTVRENLIYSGKFRLPKGTSNRSIEDLADNTLASLGLSRVANHLVGDVKRRGISGGQKKRVNIGLELMACPAILFLDEPTSGLDSSSALLVMQSLKHMVDVQNITVVSVIHQPRKFIFDLFDSLILLGVGGNMVYHGPTAEAQLYFESLNYVLPPGESVADWLIDISSGRAVPDLSRIASVASEGLELNESGEVFPVEGASFIEANVVGTTGITTGRQDHANEEAMQRRAKLFDQWLHHFETIDKFERSATYGVPEETDLPSSIVQPSFLVQLLAQIKRAFLVAYRNRFSKFIDACVLVGAVVVITALDGVAKASSDRDPNIEFEDATRPNLESAKRGFPELFRYAAETMQFLYPLKVGIIVAVLTGLQATKITTSKLTEFYREAPTNNITAYYVAINIVSTVDHSVQIVLASFLAFWLRNPWQDWIAYYTHFLLLTWISVSWALFLPQVVPPDNVVVVIGFFFAFCGLLLGGAFPPITYTAIYNEGGFKEFLSGWMSPTRYFVEALAVGELRSLPAQSGFTVEEDTPLFPRDSTAFSGLGYAGKDLNVTLQSSQGWYWSFLPALFVGLTVRFAGLGAMHAFNRSKQTKRSLLFEMKKDKKVVWIVSGFFLVLVALIAVTSWLMSRIVAPDESIIEAQERQATLLNAKANVTACIETNTCEEILSVFA